LVVTVILTNLLGQNPVFAESWWNPVTPQRIDKGYPAVRWQTSFDEFKIGRHAPINSQACVGVMDFPVMQFGSQMHLRYSEFELKFRFDHRWMVSF